MIISYNWLKDYLPELPAPEQLSRILTSIGLEVENMHAYESVKGSLAGIVTGEVLTCEKHPDADKLKLTTVNIGKPAPLQIVCGAANVAAGQKVLVATVGSTLYPVNGEPLQIKKAKIRGAESNGMICAEDEIGVGESHAGIMVLPVETVPGTNASAIFPVHADHIFEIGLTPNRMDAMSHLGTARDVCAYIRHHENNALRIRSPFPDNFSIDAKTFQITITIEDAAKCRRYSGVSISNVTVAQSPQWLQDRLRSIGVKPISNIVDITNFILHESGQPLHAFDADNIKGRQIIVKNAKENETFLSLDGKERKLSAQDLVIADAEGNICIAGVYGGLHSGVSATTKNIFLESAWFAPASVRNTSLRHGLRTDAAARFEKGTDISNTVEVLKRAAALIKEVAGGIISSDIIDVYPRPAKKNTVSISYDYLQKISGKKYLPQTVKNILLALEFEITTDNEKGLAVAAPFSKPDITIPADIAEEIMRIDGLDNIEIPSAIMIAPSGDPREAEEMLHSRAANYLCANGFSEIFTNSITNSKYYDAGILKQSVSLINSLSADLDILRPAMMQTGLEVIVYNINRKNNNLKLFEFGKTYARNTGGEASETEHLALYAVGETAAKNWQQKEKNVDLFFIKGICEQLLTTAGVHDISFRAGKENSGGAIISSGDVAIGKIEKVSAQELQIFGIKETVWHADLLWQRIIDLHKNNKTVYRELSKFPPVHRDLAVVADKNVSYGEIAQAVKRLALPALRDMKLFDVFENEKLGAGKHSLAMSFTFVDEQKTLADKDTDAMMNKITASLENNFHAVIRK